LGGIGDEFIWKYGDDSLLESKILPAAYKNKFHLQVFLNYLIISANCCSFAKDATSFEGSIFFMINFI
jgi:hypothetical protein